MSVPFDIDPYEVLHVAKDATPLEIKRAYKKLRLKYHPDKIQQAGNSVENDTFPKIQFAYSILSDAVKRQRYDQTGLMASGVDDEGGFFDWKEYFLTMHDKITIDMIDEDRKRYQNSEEERQDIVQNFIYYEGDFLKLFEVIPHLEFDEEAEQRVFAIVEEAIGDKKVDETVIKSFEKYKKSRKTKVKQMLKRLAKEAKESEKLAAVIKDKGNRRLDSERDLKALIQGRQSSRMDSLIDKLESKYGAKKGKKRAPTEEEFEKIQAGLKRRR